jgi:argininosuccinate lyase
LSILNEVIKTMIVNVDNMEDACKVGHLTATDLADYLVQKQNMPFRTAYYITKSVVAKANELSKDMSELSIDEIRSAHTDLATIDEEVVSYLDLRASMNARNSFGGTSTKQTQLQIENFKTWLETI